MRILHINDLAGVAGILCKWLRKAGHRADFISYMDDHEFSFCKYYGGKHFQDQHIMRYVLEGLLPQYDIVHMHYSYKLLPWLYQKFHGPIAMHFHGTEIATETMEARIAAQKAERILVAGEQLLQYHPRAQLLPTPVDTEIFKPMLELRKGGSLMFEMAHCDTAKALQQADIAPITIINRSTNAISYQELPKYLNQFGGYIDVKYHKQRGLLTDFSKTGLEALACGLKVLHNGQWLDELPEHHKPENVVKQLIGIYEGMLN